MRDRFNSLGLAGLVRSGTFTAEPFEPDHPAPPEAGQVPGTRSQTLIYRDDAGNVIAMVHQYLKPDGTLGGGGLADPKWLNDGGTALIPFKDPRRECAWCVARRPAKPSGGARRSTRRRRR